MQPQAPISKLPLEELIDQILSSRKITRAEECRLLSALSAAGGTDDELRAVIQRIFYGLRHGLLNVID